MEFDNLDSRPGAKTIKKNTNSTQNKSQTHNARAYKVTSYLSTDCELSTETCSRFVYSFGPWKVMEFWSRSWKVMEFDVGKFVHSKAAYCSGLS